MKVVRIFLTVLVLLFAVITVNAAPKLVVMPIAAKKSSAKHFAKALNRELKAVYGDIHGVKVISYKKAIKGSNNRKRLARCGSNLGCQKKVAQRASHADFYLFSKLLMGKGRRALVTVYLFDGAFNKLGTRKIRGERDSFETDVAEEMARQISSLLAQNLDSVEDEDSDFGDDVSSDEPDTEELITDGIRGYKNGEFKESISALSHAAKDDVVAKKLLKLVKQAVGYYKEAQKLSASGDYESALGFLARFEKADKAIRKIGKNYRVFSLQETEHSVYLSPTTKDINRVKKIYKRYARKIENARKNKVKAVAKAERWLNDRIIARIKEIERLAKENEAQKKQEKQEYAALQKKIQSLKYQWEKDDSSLEQKLVQLESKLTMMEQQEKGVIKISTKKIDDQRKKELADNAKRCKQQLADLNKEKDAFYDKQKAALEKLSKAVDIKVKKLNDKKTANEKTIKDIEQKIAAKREKFEAKERKIASDIEAKKMTFEDEDRKYRVSVEKEYQKKFDELNKKLQALDEQEAEKRKALKGFDRENEEHLTQSADEMGKIQDKIEKERAELEAKYKKDKAEARTKAEQEYEKKLATAKEAKESLEKELADKKEKSEAFIAGEEESMKAEGKKPAQIKAAIAKLKRKAKKDLAALEKKVKKASKALAKLENGKDAFIQKSIEKIDMEFEKKSAELDMKLASENQRLQKDNKTFSKKVAANKKRAEQAFKRFMANKKKQKRAIDKQIALAQKQRDKKIEKRKKDREKQIAKWEKEKKQRLAAFERSIATDKKKAERLHRENEKIEVTIANLNQKLSNRQEDLRVKQNTASDKFETTWQKRVEQAKKDCADIKENIENKYAQKEVSKKQAFQKQKEALDDEIEKLNKEKEARKEKRKRILLAEKEQWLAKKKEWKQARLDRINKIKELKKEKISKDKEDRKEAARRKKEADKQFREATKEINAKMIAIVKKKYPRLSKSVTKREIEPGEFSAKATKLKANILAKAGLKKLQKKDLVGAMESFQEALYLDGNNKTALDGLKAIESTAKTMFWEAYGIRDTNKPKARAIFKKLIKTLPPSHEFFVRAVSELESMK